MDRDFFVLSFVPGEGVDNFAAIEAMMLGGRLACRKMFHLRSAMEGDDVISIFLKNCLSKTDCHGSIKGNEH